MKLINCSLKRRKMKTIKITHKYHIINGILLKHKLREKHLRVGCQEKCCLTIHYLRFFIILIYTRKIFTVLKISTVLLTRFKYFYVSYNIYICAIHIYPIQLLVASQIDVFEEW